MKRRTILSVLAIAAALAAGRINVAAEDTETEETEITEQQESDEAVRNAEEDPIEEEISAEEEQTGEEGDTDLPWIDDDEYVSGYYTYTLSGNKATIIKYSGKENAVTIPEKLNGYMVTTIGSLAFQNKTGVTEVTLPRNLTRINSSAFQGCSSLKKLTMSNQVTRIGDNAFRNCGNSMTVHYYGTKTQWNSITIGKNNDPLNNASKIYYSISFPEKTVVILTKNTQTVVPATEPADLKNSLTWTSDNDKVVSVDKNGKVTAKTYGTTVITAKYTKNPEINASFTVKTLFYDVSDSSQSYYKPVYWGADNGVVAGFNGGEYFGPDEECTRAQFVTFLWRLAGRPTGTKDVSFPDVDPNANYFRAVKWAVSEGIIVGFKHDNAPATFEPDGVVTRGQVATMLWRYGGRKTPATGADFSDVKSSDSIFRAVSWGQEVGIIKGYKTGEFAGQFRPNDSCLRQHIVTFLYRYARDVKA